MFLISIGHRILFFQPGHAAFFQDPQAGSIVFKCAGYHLPEALATYIMSYQPLARVAVTTHTHAQSHYYHLQAAGKAGTEC